MSDPLRPRRFWYVIAGLVIVLGLLGGAGAFVSIFTNLRDSAPTTTFASGETVTVRLDPADRPGIYEATPPDGDTQCRVTSMAGKEAPVASPGGEQHVNEWELIFSVRPPTAGDYRVTCQSGEDGRFGIGKDMNLGRFIGSMFLGFGLPGLGLLAGTMIALITGLRRSSHKSRLRAPPRPDPP